MDSKKIINKIGSAIKLFWQWIKPYLIRIHKWRKKIWKKFQINKIIVLLFLVALLLMSIYLFTLAKSANVGSLKEGLKASTVIYDQEGNEAGKLFGQKGTYVELDQISQDIQEALLSTEDRNFYQHRGYDLKGIGRAVVGRLTLGKIVGGGSTITQQLAKNAFLTQEQTMDRKARELFLAIEIEKKYDKKQILEMYLNNSYFGNGVWGVEDAAKKYFGVNANEVTPGEAATLVGLLKGPSIYNPIDHLDYATDRRNTVLQLMVDNHVMEQSEADEQAGVELGSLLYDAYSDEHSDYRYPYYFDAVIAEAEEKYGVKEEDLLNKGYKIYTALDKDYQDAMQQTYEDDTLFPPNAEDGVIVQSGSVAIDPVTGGVQALVGGRGEHTYREFNYATHTQRSPGSSLKPISVYTPALEAGMKPSDLLEDSPQSYYEAENYSRTYGGKIPMYEALGESLNLPAIWTLNKIGLDTGFEKTKTFGIPLTQEDHYYGLALGGLETGVSPLTMAKAYSPFAAEGKQEETYLITKIVDSTGAIIENKKQSKTKEIITKDVANQMTGMLLGVFSSGTGMNANPPGYVMAGKTGTTETSFDGDKTKDQWVIGYTPDVVIATWLGFDETDESHYLEGSSATYASSVFSDQAQGILAYSKQTPFTVTDAYVTGGQVVTVSDEGTVNNADKWADNVKDIGDQVKEGAQNIGGRVKDGVEDIGEKVKQGIKNIFGN